MAVTPVEAAEYKQVTVLFADVVGSMDIAAKVDAERLREIMTQLVDRCTVVVHHYGGTVDKFTGDGIMALFGAPIALEDHAFRACLAAMDIQAEASRLASDVQRRDGIALRLRVGLNSGRVIAGQIGSEPLGYTAVGEQVGFAQRMESVAPPGGVMLSEFTARLVEDTVILGEPQWVRIKGFATPVLAHDLLGIEPRHAMVRRTESILVGREREMSVIAAGVAGVADGRGAVVGVVGAPGIGKSRAAREAAAHAATRGIEVFWTFCESHARDVPFHVVTRLLREAFGMADLGGAAARAHMRMQILGAGEQDLVLLDDLLGIADPEVALPAIDPDARRRRLTALVNTAALARSAPALYIVEDAQWIDGVSESMLADFLAVIPQGPSMVLITYRPEYQGELTRMHGGQTITLTPLSDSDTAALIGQLMGTDPSIAHLAAVITERAAGNPFFAEEMVRELVQREVLSGARGQYVCRGDVAEVSVPDTVQAAIEARIDRLNSRAKKTLNAAAVVGSRFDADLLCALGIDPVFDELLTAELIDRVKVAPRAEYSFRHPLIRAVAYESQLRSDRAALHRQLAAAIESTAAESTEQYAALIAEHLQAAGEHLGAYDWHMRAGTWSTIRDTAAARTNWLRAREIADSLPDDETGRTAMRIAPRTMLCATAWRSQTRVSDDFDELRELCNAAGDKASLAIGMTGRATDLLFDGRAREASRLVTEQMALLESIGNPTLTIGLTLVATHTKFDTGEFADMLRWSQIVIDLAGGDPTKGAGFGVGSPLAVALTYRGVARWWLGLQGWRSDLRDAIAMVRCSDPATYGLVVTWTYGFAICYGVLLADDAAMREMEAAVQAAEESSDDIAVTIAEYTLGIALLYRDSRPDRQRGFDLVTRVRDRWTATLPYQIPVADGHLARETARRGDRSGAIPVMRGALDGFHQAGRLSYVVWATGVLVETLCARGEQRDLVEAQAAIDRMVDLRADEALAVRDITLVRLRALLFQARGDVDSYRACRDRYRQMSADLGFDGHRAWAETM